MNEGDEDVRHGKIILKLTP